MSTEPGPRYAESRGRLLLPLAVAAVALLMLLAAGPGSRLGLWHFRTGFRLMEGSAYVALFAIFTGCMALAGPIRRKQRRPLTITVLSLLLALGVLAVPLFWKLSAGKLPKIHDISTDTANPPPFDAIIPLRSSAPNPASYGGSEIAAQQLTAYPALKTLPLPYPPEQVFTRALQVAAGMGWKIVAAVPAEGRIEASDTTFWFGFVDDIVIRITPAGSGSKLDIRSVSRIGLSDVGTNARRIGKFLSRLPR